MTSAVVDKALTAPDGIARLLQALVDRELAVWLIGSRANGTAGNDSDWDVLLFGSAALLQELAGWRRPEGLDLLVVFDGNEFRSPWRRPDGLYNKGGLDRWEWQEQSADLATYCGSKDERMPGLKAIRVRAVRSERSCTSE